ncbi:alcohol dehydrogenase 1-like [Lycium barbarum]|uniref:alcohol dehydrogenase 1-like n=1 Tax=Lycium barbarum TaxID=112863 RepID=UPI00293ED886|nr:alcohol dehydrogenase 1-like [Lycium barbarum]
MDVVKPAKRVKCGYIWTGSFRPCCCSAEGARIAGASRIIGVDLNGVEDSRKQLIHEFYLFSTAKKFGVTEFLNSMDSFPNGSICNKRKEASMGQKLIIIYWILDCLIGLSEEPSLETTSVISRPGLPSVVEKHMNKELELEKFITHKSHLLRSTRLLS